jgi:polyisoprenoid-binding protein YceI
MTMKKKVFFYPFVSMLLFIATYAYAAAPEWKIDPDHSGIYFRITHIYATVNGFFPDFVGEINFDPSHLDESHFAFKVKVKSIDTNNSKRDSHLQSDEFFDTGKYPEMSFESKTIKHLEANNYQVQGTLTIKDVSKTVTFPFIYFGHKKSPFNPKLDVAGFEARLSIDRLEYNVGSGKFYKMGVVGRKVDVLVTLEATRESNP